ncbi:hypothetical protein BDV95DRAFT_606315 [Massariosphaeria phaeospora]|uniref:Cupredoxin n=1 Tax=Massariosphaeria phaeospora TaxID=100035 RepID=A0A7C8IFC0_9PLEO|nr:hypothetical protein BDV95DRAFT_606315 [Massariosphaeria phaeospora]
MYTLPTLLLATIPTLTLAAKVHTVFVGKDGKTFTPQVVSAEVGDQVVYTFSPSHDVVQSDFSSPCAASADGIYSGPFSGTEDGKKKFLVKIENTDPVYYYCSTEKHCQDGMVGGINVPKDGNATIDAYANAAKTVPESNRPDALRKGELLDDQGLATATPSATPDPTTTPTESSSEPTGTATEPESTGAAAVLGGPGSVNAGLAVVLGVAGWFL